MVNEVKGGQQQQQIPKWTAAQSVPPGAPPNEGRVRTVIGMSLCGECSKKGPRMEHQTGARLCASPTWGTLSDTTPLHVWAPAIPSYNRSKDLLSSSKQKCFPRGPGDPCRAAQEYSVYICLHQVSIYLFPSGSSSSRLSADEQLSSPPL